MIAIQLSTQIKQWMKAAIHAMNLDEEVIYDASLQGLPTEVEDSWVPVVVLYLEIATSVPGRSVYGSPHCRPYALTETIIADLTRDGMDRLMKARDEFTATLPKDDTVTVDAESEE